MKVIESRTRGGGDSLINHFLFLLLTIERVLRMECQCEYKTFPYNLFAHFNSLLFLLKMHESFSRPSKPNVGLIIIRQISISTFLICSSVLINYSLANSISRLVLSFPGKISTDSITIPIFAVIQMLLKILC